MKAAHILVKAAALTSVLVGVSLASAPAEAAGWRWSVIPYLWASDVSMEVEQDGEPVGGIDLAFGDLLDKVDLASQMHLEGRRGRYGILFDLTYVDAGQSQEVMGVGIFPDIDIFIVEAGGFFSTNEEEHGLDLLYGARLLDISQKIDLVLPTPPSISGPRVPAVDISESLLDAFAGLRYTAALGQKGSFGIRGDYGAGDSDGTVNLVVGFGYGLGQSGKYRLLIGYRHMEIEIEDGPTETEMEMSGPILGLRINLGR